MAARIEPDVILPISTGQVETPGPITIEQPNDAASTGAVPAPATVVTTEFGATGPHSTATVETPGPVTTRSSWAKVVRPQQRSEPRTTTAETRTQAPRTPETRPADSTPQPQPRPARSFEDDNDGR